MKVGIVGAGHIGGNLARLFAAADHEVTVSFGRDAAKLGELAVADLGGRTAARHNADRMPGRGTPNRSIR